MKRYSAVLILAAVFVLMTGTAMAACTMTPGDPDRFSWRQGSDVTVELFCTCDASGGAISSTLIPETAILGMSLVEVEIVPGNTCASVPVTIRNGRTGPDGLGTKIWGIDAIETTKGQLYGGHIVNGIFPLFDGGWFFSSADLGPNGSATVYIKFSK